MPDPHNSPDDNESDGIAEPVGPRTIRRSDLDPGLGMFYFQTDLDAARSILADSPAILERLKITPVTLSEFQSTALIEQISWISRQYHHELKQRDLVLDTRPLHSIAISARQLLSQLDLQREALRLIAPEIRQNNRQSPEFLLEIYSNLELLARACDTPLEIERRRPGRPGIMHVRNAVGSLAALWETFTGLEWVRNPLRRKRQYVYEGNVFVEEAMLRIDARLLPGTVATALKEFDLSIISKNSD